MIDKAREFSKNAEKPLISVIIPVYNTETYIGRCLDSIINESYRNLEIICVDDGSSDNSLVILQEYAAKDDRILIIEKENGGVSSARNEGLTIANGEYVAFVDSDDYVHPQYFELLMETAQRGEANVAACGYLYGQEEFHEWQPVHNDEVGIRENMALTEILEKHALKSYSTGKIYNKTVIANLRFDEEIHLAEDTVFNLTALCKCENLHFAYVQEELYYYYMREESAVHNIKPISLLTGVERVYLPLYNTFGKNKTIVLEQAIRAMLSCRFLNFFAPDEYTKQKCSELMKEGRKHLKDLPIKKRMLYEIFIRFPYIYRCFRVYNDPGMKRWERNVKRARRAERL